MKEIKIVSTKARVRKVKSLMTSVGNRLGAVWFYKRSSGKVRRMVFRINVSAPTYVKSPKGESKVDLEANDLINVFDCNIIRNNKKGFMNGRGGYKSIPLDQVFRLKVNGQIYRIKS